MDGFLHHRRFLVEIATRSTKTVRALPHLYGWPRSARDAHIHAALAAVVLWTAAVVIYAAGRGDRSIAGPLKGADFVQFYTMGSLARTLQTAPLYDFEAFHGAQAALVPESAAELYPPVYPPHVALLFAPFSRLSFAGATLVWNLITIALFALIVRSAWRPVAGILDDSRFLFAAAAAFPPFWSLVLHGQATMIVLGAFWLAWLALERQRPFFAGMAFGLLLIKPQFAIPIALVVLVCREWSMLCGAVASVAIQAGAAAAVLGTSAITAYARFLPAMMQNAELLEPKPYQSHSLRALTRLAPAWIGVPLWIVLACVAIAAAIRVWRSGAPLRVRVGLLVLTAVLVNPHLIVYDATVLALPLIWFAAHVVEHGSAVDGKRFLAIVYWMYVAFLAPSAAVIGIQISVLLMAWLAVTIAQTAMRDGVLVTAQRPGRTFSAASFSPTSLPTR